MRLEASFFPWASITNKDKSRKMAHLRRNKNSKACLVIVRCAGSGCTETRMIFTLSFALRWPAGEVVLQHRPSPVGGQHTWGSDGAILHTSYATLYDCMTESAFYYQSTYSTLQWCRLFACGTGSAWIKGRRLSLLLPRVLRHVRIWKCHSLPSVANNKKETTWSWKDLHLMAIF